MLVCYVSLSIDIPSLYRYDVYIYIYYILYLYVLYNIHSSVMFCIYILDRGRFFLLRLLFFTFLILPRAVTLSAGMEKCNDYRRVGGLREVPNEQ